MSFRRLLAYTVPHRNSLLLILLLLLVSAGLSLLQPWLAGQLTNAILEPSPRWGLTQVLLAWVLLMVLRALLGFASQYTIGSVGEQMSARLRIRLYQHLQALPLGYFHGSRAGDTLAILSNDADIMSRFFTGTLVQLLPLLLTFTGALVLMALLDPVIAGLTLLLLPAYYLLIKILGRQIRPLSRAWIDAYSGMLAQLNETLEMIPAIKAFTREEIERQRFDSQNQDLLGLARRRLWAQALLGPAVTLLAGLGLILLLWLAGQRVADGSLTPAELVSLLLYATLMAQPLRSLADVYGRLQMTRGAAERIQDFLEEAPEPGDEGLPDLDRVRGEIEFQGVSYAYPDGTTVLTDYSLHIAAGETLAITGKNGSGKSTLAHLLMRFADPQAGSVMLDGQDIRTISISSLRRQVGLVAQHTLLLNGTVAENIAYGEPAAEPGAIERAARQAHAHDFISALPSGYDTVIGDNGVRLSGGQRQRLALARALLVDAPILVFDEATAMFDPEGEEAFINECRDLLGGRTVVLITHRPASLSLAGRSISMG